MQKKSIIAILSAVVLTVVASLALVFTVGPMASAADETVYTVPVEYLNLTNDGKTLGDNSYNDGNAFNEDGKTWIQNHAKYRVEIPAGVTNIEDCAFYSCHGLTSITIPEGVTSIGGQAFRNCRRLTSITIPSSVTRIGELAFAVCRSLTSITFAENSQLTSIGDYAFSDCSGLTSITLPAGVTSIGERAFYDCSGLTSITIPSSVTSIGERAFFYCSGLTSITIPSSVTSIGDYAFENCSGLTSITVDPNNTKYTSQDNEGHECNCIIEKSSNKLLFGCQSTIIPAGVTSIGERAFYDCSGLTSITIPESVTSIGGVAFASCSGLKSITIPSSVTSIGDSAFNNCRSLTSITFAENSQLTSIGDYAFYCCSGLTSITIPSSVTSIGEAFGDCSGLNEIIVRNPDLKYNSNLEYGNNATVYYGAEQNTVTFNTMGGTEVSAQVINFGELIEVPNTKKEGSNVIGWYLDEEYTKPFTLDTPVKYDINLYAKWEEVQAQPEPETPDEETSTAVNNQNNDALILGITGTAAGILIIGGIVFGIVITKRRRK